MPRKVLTYRWFAKMYHWPPWVVDELPLMMLDWCPAIEHAEAEAEDQRMKQESRAAARR